MLYIPRGEKIRSGEKVDVSEVIEELKPMEFTGYIEVAYKIGRAFYLGHIFLFKGEPFIAGLEEVIGKIKILGIDAFKMMLGFKQPLIDVYRLDEDKIPLCVEYNPEEAFLRDVEELKEEPEYPVLRYGIVADNLVESTEANLKSYIARLKDFTGVVTAKADSKEAIVLLQNGKIKGAAYFDVGEAFSGTLAVNLLDFKAKIESYAKRAEEVEKVIKRNPEIEVFDREELFKKYRIKPPEEEEIDKLLKAAVDDLVEKGLKKKSLS
jgi:hypothetical protein